MANPEASHARMAESDRSGHPRGSLHPAALAATAGPIEREHLHAVARGFGHGCGEEGAAVRADLAQHPDRRAADDLAGGVEAIDLKAHAPCGPHGLVVDITLDRRPLLAVRHLPLEPEVDRKSTRLNSSHLVISYAVFCLKKKKKKNRSYPFDIQTRRRHCVAALCPR